MDKPTRIAVAGATGRTGRQVVAVLEGRRFPLVAMSRGSGVDLSSGDGLEPALSGAACIIDVSDAGSADEGEARAFFAASARNLQAAGLRAGVGSIVAVSILGCDRYPAGYNAAKRAHELALLSGPLPVQLLRSAPFHEFVPQVLTWDRRGEVCFVPQMRTALVAARAVAEVLVDLATRPGGLSAEPISEVAGPEAVTLLDQARLFAARRGDPLRVEEDPDDPDRELNLGGALLPGPHARRVGPTFQAWLDALPDLRAL